MGQELGKWLLPYLVLVVGKTEAPKVCVTRAGQGGWAAGKSSPRPTRLKLRCPFTS